MDVQVISLNDGTFTGSNYADKSIHDYNYISRDFTKSVNFTVTKTNNIALKIVNSWVFLPAKSTVPSCIPQRILPPFLTLTVLRIHFTIPPPKNVNALRAFIVHHQKAAIVA